MRCSLRTFLLRREDDLDGRTDRAADAAGAFTACIATNCLFFPAFLR